MSAGGVRAGTPACTLLPRAPAVPMRVDGLRMTARMVTARGDCPAVTIAMAPRSAARHCLPHLITGPSAALSAYNVGDRQLAVFVRVLLLLRGCPPGEVSPVFGLPNSRDSAGTPPQNVCSVPPTCRHHPVALTFGTPCFCPDRVAYFSGDTLDVAAMPCEPTSRLFLAFAGDRPGFSRARRPACNSQSASRDPGSRRWG